MTGSSVNTPLARRKINLINKKTAPWIFLFPTLVIFAIFMLYPIVSSLILSFQSADPLNPGFVWFDNYLTLLKDSIFWKSLGNTILYLIIQVPVMIILSVLLASIINQKFIRGKGLYRMSLFLPAITSLVAYSMVMKLLFNTEYGLINYLIKQPIEWLNHPIYSKMVIIIAITWRWTGYNMVIVMAGFSNISEDMYESADIDGASFLQKLFHITIPLLKPVLLFVAITSTIGTLQLFDESMILTKGGPDNATISIGHYLYNVGFRYFKFEYAAALSYVLVLIIGVLSLIEALATGKEE